jgi:hypothetical protein
VGAPSRDEHSLVFVLLKVPGVDACGGVGRGRGSSYFTLLLLTTLLLLCVGQRLSHACAVPSGDHELLVKDAVHQLQNGAFDQASEQASECVCVSVCVCLCVRVCVYKSVCVSV